MSSYAVWSLAACECAILSSWLLVADASGGGPVADRWFDRERFVYS